jgi:hypothetical protein
MITRLKERLKSKRFLGAVLGLGLAATGSVFIKTPYTEHQRLADQIKAVKSAPSPAPPQVLANGRTVAAGKTALPSKVTLNTVRKAVTATAKANHVGINSIDEGGLPDRSRASAHPPASPSANAPAAPSAAAPAHPPAYPGASVLVTPSAAAPGSRPGSSPGGLQATIPQSSLDLAQQSAAALGGINVMIKASGTFDNIAHFTQDLSTNVRFSAGGQLIADGPLFLITSLQLVPVGQSWVANLSLQAPPQH